MKISNYINDKGNYLQVIKAIYVKDYKIDVFFSDGKHSLVDFGRFLSASRHPEIRQYLDTKLFKGYKIYEGNLVWNDFDLIFPIEDLYANDILHITKEAVI